MIAGAPAMREDDDLVPVTIDDDAATPSALRPRQPIFSWFAFSAAAISVLLMFAVFVLLTPKMEDVYKDFGTKLPGATQLMLDVSRWCAKGGWLILLPIPPVVALIVPQIFRSPDGTRPRLMNWLVGLVCLNLFLLALNIIVVIALILPMMSLITNISGPSGKR